METNYLATIKKIVWNKALLLGFILVLLLGGIIGYGVWRQAKIIRGINTTYTDGSVFDAIAVMKRYQEYTNLWDVNRCDIAWNEYVGSGSKERHQQKNDQMRNRFDELFSSTKGDVEKFTLCKGSLTALDQCEKYSFFSDEKLQCTSDYYNKERSCENQYPDFSAFNREFGIGYIHAYDDAAIAKERENLTPIITSKFKEKCERNSESADRVDSLVVGEKRADISLVVDFKEEGVKAVQRHNMTWVKEADGKWYRDW